MNIPPNVRLFSLDLAQQGHPICTRTGTSAKFIAYVPDNRSYHKVVVSIIGEVYSCGADGVFTDLYETETDLFLAPLGYCEGKPVFAGDKLIGADGEYTISVAHKEFTGFKWPSKVLIVETRMHYADFIEFYKIPAEEEFNKAYNDPGNFTWSSNGCKVLANKAIERAILDGDVIPTSAVKNMLTQSYKDKWNKETIEDVINKQIEIYLEGLKK